MPFHGRSPNRAAAEIGEKSIRHYPFPRPLSNHPTDGRVPAARPHHASSARIPLYGILATTSIHPTLSRLSCGSTSGARATSRSSCRLSGPALREHAAVLLHKRPRVDQRFSTPGSSPIRKLGRGLGDCPRVVAQSLPACPPQMGIARWVAGHIRKLTRWRAA
jgi:hypothetical protein